MSITKRTIELSRTNNSGVITSIPTNIPKYNQYLYGVRQGSYVNLIAETGVGKTTLGRHLYIHTPYEYYLQVNDDSKLDVLFLDFSLEIADTVNLANAFSRKIYLDHNKVIPIASFFKWGDNKLTDEEAALRDSYEPYFDRFESKCVVVDGEVSPTLFHDVCLEAAKRHGKFEREGRWISQCGVWRPNNPNLFIIGLMDTVNLAEGEAVKIAIDKMSRYAVLFRNKCNFFFCFLQQISAELASTDRSRQGVVSPIIRDAEDSRRPGKDANIVLGLHEPLRHLKDGHTTFKGYDMIQLQSWLKTLHILKHREGVMNKYIPLKAYGGVGYYTQLPEAKDMNAFEYEKAVNY